MKRREPRVKVSRRRGLADPEVIAKSLADYLLGRTNTPPTIYISNSPKGAA